MRSSFDSKVVYPVTFLADSGSPDTFITPAVLQALGLGEDTKYTVLLEFLFSSSLLPTFQHTRYGPAYSAFLGRFKKAFRVHIADPEAHYANVNLLGTSVLWHGNLQAHKSKGLLTWVPDEGW